MAPHEGWFSFEEIPLKWHYAVGLLYDIFSGATPTSTPTTPDPHQIDNKRHGDGDDGGDGLPSHKASGPLPWQLTVHFSAWPDEQLVRLDAKGCVLHDAFINSVKEADFLRNGTAKGIMALSKDDSTQLWTAVQERNYPSFFSSPPPSICSSPPHLTFPFPFPLHPFSINFTHHHLDSLPLFLPISQKLLHAQGAPLRHIPLKVYLPSPPSTSSPSTPTPSALPISHLRVVQSPIPPTVAGTRESQTLGSALHSLLPALFPSRRTPIVAKAMLHGAVVPLGANLEELVRWGAYADGWVHLGVVMMG